MMPLFGDGGPPLDWVQTGGIITVVGMFIWYIREERAATKDLVASHNADTIARDKAHAEQINDIARANREMIMEINAKYNALMLETTEVMRDVSLALVETRHETRANTEATIELRRMVEASNSRLAGLNSPPPPPSTPPTRKG